MFGFADEFLEVFNTILRTTKKNELVFPPSSPSVPAIIKVLHNYNNNNSHTSLRAYLAILFSNA